MFDETLQSGDSCFWLDDEFDSDDQEPLYDEKDEDNDDGEGDDDEDGPDDEPLPSLIQYRCSPVCRFSPTVRMLAERYSEQINELLNLFSGALTNSVYVHAPYPPYRFTSRLDRLYHGRLLQGPGELKAVDEEVRAEWDRLHDDLLSVTADSDRREFQRVEHHLRDFRMLVALAGCHARHVFHWWDTTLIQLQQSEVLHCFYTARDGMRGRDPEERTAARARDAKRRKTRHRKEYLAEFEARPEVRAKRAERKRAARAAARAQRGDKTETGLRAPPSSTSKAVGAVKDERDRPAANGSGAVRPAVEDVQAA